MQYQENHIAFLERALLEHGVNYNWFVSHNIAGEGYEPISGFEQVLYTSNDDLNNFITNGGVISELYHYDMILDNNIKANEDNVIAYNIIPAKCGYILNSDLDKFHNHFINDAPRPQINNKEFVKSVNYIHHNPRTPEQYHISKGIANLHIAPALKYRLKQVRFS